MSSGELGMKCPNCGAENPDAETYCQKCASPLEMIRKTPGDLKARRRRKLVVAATIIIALAIIIPSVVYFYEDPRYSWNSSIRDHDGDGVPDNSDPRPFDRSILAWASATVNLTVHNNYSNSVDFYWQLHLASSHDYLFWEPTVPVGGTLVKSKNLTWLMGEPYSDWVISVSWHLEGLNYGTRIDFGIFEMNDRGSFAFAATFPDDFPPPLP